MNSEIPRARPVLPSSRPLPRRAARATSLAPALTALVLASVAPLPAATVLESFNDVGGATNGITLTTLNTTGVGGIGFTSKYEQTGSGVPVLRTNDLVVPLVNYVSGQASNSQHWCVAAVTTSSGAARRTQTKSTPTLSGTIWFSFLGTLYTTNGDVALTFNQVSKPAVSQVSKLATSTRSGGSPIWKSAIQQVWKPALPVRAALDGLRINRLTLRFVL